MNKIPLRLLIAFIFLLSGIKFSTASIVSVRILTTKVINTFIFSPATGSYKIVGDGFVLADLVDPSGIYQMSIVGDSILLKTFEKTIGKFSSIKIYSKETAAFKIKSVIPESKVRMYDDDLDIMLTPDKKQFLLINKVD